MISITVIPDKEKLNVPIYHKEASDSNNHHNLLIEFCNLIGINCDINDVYKSLIEINCVIIITIERPMKLIGTYLPENIKLDQKETLERLRELFAKFEYINFFTFFSKSIDISRTPGLDKDLILDYFYEELNNFYSKDTRSQR